MPAPGAKREQHGFVPQGRRVVTVQELVVVAAR
jgi:hypothetical protein